MFWLEVSTSNEMPEILGKYYLDAIKQYDMTVNVKVDDGTKHSLVQLIQLFFKLQKDGGDLELNSFSIVPRIAGFWSLLEWGKISWWKQLFQDMTDLNLFFKMMALCW